MKRIVKLSLLLGSLLLTACASTFDPRMSGNNIEAPRLPTAKEIRAGVELSVEEYYSSHKSRRAFDADVGTSGVVPILIHLKNNSDESYRIERKAMRAMLNDIPLVDIPGLEAAEVGALRNPAWNALVNTAAIGPLAIFFGVGTIAATASQTQKINRQIEHHFEQMELPDRVLKPSETASGFVFFRIPSQSLPETTNLTLEMTLERERLNDYSGQPLVYHLKVPLLSRQG